MAGSLTFGPMTGHGAIVVVVGNIHKLPTETIQVRLCCVFVSLVPSDVPARLGLKAAAKARL